MAYQSFKRCSMCCVFLSREHFNVRRNGEPSAYCKQCNAAYCRAHYRRNITKHNARRYENSKRYRRRNREFVLEYLRSHPCVDCGETDLVVLEFDHVEEKRWDLGYIGHRDCPLATIQSEIERCVVRCANCHRRRTARQFGWKKGRVELVTGRSSAW